MGVLAHGQTHRVDVVNGTYGTLSFSRTRNTRKKGRNVVVRIRVSRKEEDKIDSVVVRNRNRREMNGYWPPPAEIRRLESGHVWIGGAREAR